MKRMPAILALCGLIAGCESGTALAPEPGEAIPPSFSLSPCLRPPGAKLTLASATPDPNFRLNHQSRDSLNVVVPFWLNCGLSYDFQVHLTADTVAVQERVTGGATALCACRKELTVALRAVPGQDFRGLQAVKAGGQVFPFPAADP